jgi:hypothetical protein
MIRLIAVIGAGSIFLYSRSQKNNSAKNTSASEIESTVAAVAELIELPNETPTLATVSDIDKLKDQEFFTHAENGDKVLIFKNARKAILYRPFTNKIIEVGPIRVDESSVAGTATTSAQVASPTVVLSPTAEPTPTAVPSKTSAITVAVYNGTKVTGLSRKTADELSKQFQDITIQSTGNAAGNYTKTVVIDLSKKNKSTAESIAKFLKGEVGSMPKGEATPEAEILVLVGSVF